MRVDYIQILSINSNESERRDVQDAMSLLFGVCEMYAKKAVEVKGKLQRRRLLGRAIERRRRIQSLVSVKLEEKFYP